MPLRWRSRRRFDGIAAGERSLAGQEATLKAAKRLAALWRTSAFRGHQNIG
ncbi:Uncharacterised protein [Burkholderia pseudomallei]|nr:Uncharacterised protein [Burkholderia pseudomallei]VCK86744.1 Uncharacterised protein [Burkholderia pseudomallei]